LGSAIGRTGLRSGAVSVVRLWNLNDGDSGVSRASHHHSLGLDGNVHAVMINVIKIYSDSNVRVDWAQN